MVRIAAAAPGMSFNDADLYLSPVGVDTGLLWHITVASGSTYRTFLADRRGRVRCERDRTIGTRCDPLPAA